jgi:Predicted metal-binding, possibly nucleic acid-binding protein
MRLNLCEIIEMPGSSLPFSCELDTERLVCPAIKSFVSSPFAEGIIRNGAGVLTLTGTIKADMVCICDRCSVEFHCDKVIPLEVRLAADISDEDDPEIFPLDGNWLDLSDVLETCFILNTEAKFLCREDCAGLCPRCGKNLSDGPCGCQKEIDPRLAVLGQLLDKQTN